MVVASMPPDLGPPGPGDDEGRATPSPADVEKVVTTSHTTSQHHAAGTVQPSGSRWLPQFDHADLGLVDDGLVGT
jgi:hypothetical protein